VPEPDYFLPVHTYARVQQYMDAWRHGEIANLCIVGRGGIGKTHFYESMPLRSYHLFRGKTSAVNMFLAIQQEPDVPIIFDDVGTLLKDPACLDLVKQIADTQPQRIVRWNTRYSKIETPTFSCLSSVLIVLNWIPKDNSDVAAIVDRFHCLHFLPTKAEICRIMRTIADDPTDVDVIESLAVDPSLRDFIRFQQSKRSKYIDHIQELKDKCGIPPRIQMIMDVLQNKNWGDKLKAFHELHGGTYAAAKRYWERNKVTAERLLVSPTRKQTKRVVKKRSAEARSSRKKSVTDIFAD
jgi:hypothetical protein